jgi:hypothetical protein
MNKHIIILLVIILILFVGCVQDLPISPKNADRKITVNCILSNKDTQTLTLTYSSPGNNGTFLFSEVSDADITLYENGNKAGYFIKDGYGTWILEYTPTEGAQYTLKVKISGEADIEAKTTMPYRLKVADAGSEGLGITKYFKEESGKDQYWFCCFGSAKQAIPPEIKGLLPAPPPDGTDKMQSLFGTDHPYADRLTRDEQMLTVLLPSANTPAYKYYVRCVVDSAAPPFRFKVQSGTYGPSFYVVFRNASKEYDEYLRTSIVKMLLRTDETDPIIWFDENVVYSNIKNGLGIFGAYYQTWFQFSRQFDYPVE